MLRGIERETEEFEKEMKNARKREKWTLTKKGVIGGWKQKKNGILENSRQEDKIIIPTKKQQQQQDSKARRAVPIRAIKVLPNIASFKDEM